jgi:2-oxoglutarate ferredoxin oxidoreductase subunit delta
MIKVEIDKDGCKGCAKCTTACPKGIMVMAKNELNVKGVHPAEVTDQDECTSCTLCAVMCPDLIITVRK